MPLTDEYPYLKPRVSLAERVKNYFGLLILGIAGVSLLAAGVAMVMFFAMFLLPGYTYLTDDSFLSPQLARRLFAAAMVPCLGIALTAPDRFFQALVSGFIVGGVLFGCLVMDVYSASYITKQWRFRHAPQASYVFRIAWAEPCGKSGGCAYLVWDGDANPYIFVDVAARKVIQANTHLRDVPKDRQFPISERFTESCVSLPVENAGDAARIPERKFHEFTTTDFIACPTEADILRSWPPRAP